MLTLTQQTPRQVGSVLEVVPDVACLQLSIVNVCFVGEAGAADRSWALVDAGLWTSGGAIVRAAEERFGRGSRPACIVLTHGHFDHVGVVEELADRWQAPVYAHALEMPYLTGRSSYPPPDPTVGGGAFSFLSRIFPNKPIDLGARVSALPEDGGVPGMPGWRWIHTLGHAPGHISLFRDEDRALIAGDAFVTTRQESALAVLTQWQPVWRPPAYFTCDWGQARRSVERLAELNPSTAVTGHGVPMFGERLHRELAELAEHFDRFVPSHGRYVNHPAHADRSGVTALPPSPADPLPIVLAVGGLALGGLVLLGEKSRR
jgi:glyoxylase-like metal-dependent hydrolase (beta-lactamase superfamily II)